MSRSDNTVPTDMSPKHNDDPMLADSSEMGKLMRSIDWSQTPLGDIDTWSPSLRSVVTLCLYSRFPHLIWWGRELTQIYNDAYRPILGLTKHPAAMGKRGAETWQEAWHILGPLVESVFREQKATWSDDQFLPVQRYGFIEETYFTFSYSPIFDETNRVGGILITCTETTKRILSERRLRTLRDLAARSSEGKQPEAACQIAAHVLSSNPADIPFALLYLLAEDQRTARLVGTTVNDHDLASWTRQIDLTKPTAKSWPFSPNTADFQVVDIATQLSPVLSSIWPEPPEKALVLPLISASQNQIVGYCIAGLSSHLMFDDDYKGFLELIAGHISTAIANARAYEEERQRAEALAELDRAKTEFFSNISHEFRTPLTLILNPLQELLREVGSTLPAPQQENLEIVQRSSLRLLKLVNTLLDFSRIQANRIEASYEPVDLSTLTADLVGNFRSVIERAGLRLNINCPPMSEPVYVDKEMWEKIIFNLLSNAFKFTFEGDITVSIQPLPETVELTISDTGIGIAEGELPNIFNRFHRVRGARARTYEGSGIGLALVQELVRFHGGNIRVVSQVDQGTTFTIALPRGYAHLPPDQIGTPRTLTSTATGVESYTQEALSWLPAAKDTAELGAILARIEASTPTPIASVSPANARILVVDDNADMRDYIRRLLQQKYHVETAIDGQAALKIIRMRQPDLVLTDIMMPKLDGFGLLQQLRADPTMHNLPIILLSARAGEEARSEGLEAGADDYLVKPFSTRELLASVHANLQLAYLRRQLLEQEQANQRDIQLRIERISRLQSVTAKLSQSLTLEQVAHALVDEGIEALKASAGSLNLLEDDNTLVVVYTAGGKMSEQTRKAWSRYPVDARTPTGDAVLRHVPFWFESGDDQLMQYPAMSDVVKFHAGAWIILPLIIEERVLGTIGFAFHERRQFDQEERNFILTLAQQCAQAVQRAQLYEAELKSRQLLQSQVGLQSVISELGQDALANVDLPRLMEKAVTLLGQTLGIEYTSIFELHPRDQMLILRAGFGWEADLIGQVKLSIGTESHAGYTLLTHQSVIVEDLPSETRFHGSQALLDHNIISGMSVIIGDPDKPFGVLSVHSRESRTFTTDDVYFIQSVANILATIVERSKLEARLRRSNEELQHFAYIASHDLQEPLRMVTSYVQLLEKRYAGQLDKDAHEFINFAVDGAVRMKALINALLAYSRIDTGDKDFKDFSAQVALDRAIANLALQIEDTQTQITHDELPFIHADFIQIVQLFQNLINNAIKFRQADTPKIHIGVERNLSEWQFSVQDNGIGIPADSLERIFIIFQRLHSKEEYPGTGIGLSISKRVIERHGGRIWVTSTLGQGTTFYFTIPY